MTGSNAMIRPTAEVSLHASIGGGTSVWRQAQVREGAVVGRNCILGKDMYVDFNVRIGDNAKVRQIGWACRCGERLTEDGALWRCPVVVGRFHPAARMRTCEAGEC